jgi:hypothetical protein
LTIQSRSNAQLNIGGVFGYIIGDDEEGSSVNVENCLYEDGDITTISTLGSGFFNVGGFAGFVSSYSSFSNCRSLAGSVSVHSNRQIYVGGFAGELNNAAIEDCYALANVFSTCSALQYTGGLVGMANNSAISRCYATGSVQATSAGGGSNFSIGGLVGLANNATTISDSYALGNVRADKTAGSGPVIAGGLVGNCAANSAIKHCFAAGMVTAQCPETGATISAGVLAGSVNSTARFRHNAALGVSVTTKGPGTKFIGRVSSSTSAALNNNHAVNTMLLFSDVRYTHPYPIEISTTNAATGKDGADVADSDLRTQAFWTTLGFTAEWDFSRVYSNRHPTLTGLGGQ